MGTISDGRLGYNLSQVPIENRSENFGWMMVHTPTNINNFNDHIIVDIVAMVLVL